MKKDKLYWFIEIPTTSGAYWCRLPDGDNVLVNIISAENPYTKEDMLVVEWGEKKVELCNTFFKGHVWFGPLEEPSAYILHS